MPLFNCPNCQQPLSSQQDVAGVAFTCPACNQLVTGPGATGVTMTASTPVPANSVSPNPSGMADQVIADYPQYSPVQPPQYQPPLPYQPTSPYQQPQYQSPPPLSSSSGFSWRTALTVLTCVLLVAVLVKQFWPAGDGGDPTVPPAPAPTPVKNIAEDIVSGDTSAAYYLSRVFTRAAQLIERDGQAEQPRLTKTEQVAEDFIAALGVFSIGGKFEGKFVGLPAYIADNFKQSGFPTTEGELTAEARASAVKTCTTMADVFLKVADQVK